MTPDALVIVIGITALAAPFVGLGFFLLSRGSLGSLAPGDPYAGTALDTRHDWDSAPLRPQPGPPAADADPTLKVVP